MSNPHRDIAQMDFRQAVMALSRAAVELQYSAYRALDFKHNKPEADAHLDDMFRSLDRIAVIFKHLRYLNK